MRRSPSDSGEESKADWIWEEREDEEEGKRREG